MINRLRTAALEEIIEKSVGGGKEKEEGEGRPSLHKPRRRVGRPRLLSSPVLDTQNELVEAIHMLEAGLVGDRVHNEEAIPRAHVLFPHGTELLLPSGVQNWRGKRSFRGCPHSHWSHSRL